MLSHSIRIVVILLMGLLLGCKTPLYFTKDLPSQETPTQASLANGHRLYQEYCMRCHGEHGKGNGPDANKLEKKPANLVKRDVHVSVVNMAVVIESPYHSKMTMAWNISDGKNEMPAWKDILNKEAINDLTNYIKYLQYNAENPPAQ